MNIVESAFQKYILSRFTQRQDLIKLITNTIWLLSDRIIRLTLGFYVSLQVTNYLGKDQYGLMSGAMAFAVLFAPLTNLGIDSLIVRELVKTPERRNELLGTGLVIKLIGSAFALLVGSAASYFYFDANTLKAFISFWQLLTFFVLSFDVIDLLYQSVVKSKYTVYAKNSALLITSATRLIFLSLKAPLLWFVYAQFGEYVIALLIGLFILLKQGISPLHWSFNKSVAKTILKESWMLALSGFVILIYMRIDQVMVSKLVGDGETGIYTAAVRISELWYFIPLAITSSTLPNIIKARELGGDLYLKKFQRLFDLLIWLSIIVGIGTQLLGQWAIELIYKPEYHPAGSILILHIWAGIFVSFGSASVHYYIVNGKSHLNFWRTLAGAASNVILNFFFIPSMGGIGAALATVISYGVSDVVGHLFFAESRVLIPMFLKAFNPFGVLKRLKD